MEDITAVNVEAYNYLNAFGKERWANAFVEGQHYDMLTSNAAECTNIMLKDIRVLPIVKQAEETRAKLMEFFQKRHADSLNINNRLTPYAKKILSQETGETRRLHVRLAKLAEFEGQSSNYMDVVHLDRRSCVCYKWEILGIPCSQAISSMRARHYNPYDYCENWFSTSVYQSTYNEGIYTTCDNKWWEQMSIKRVLLLTASKRQGRSKKQKFVQKIGTVTP